jgi:hypothetical protein
MPFRGRDGLLIVFGIRVRLCLSSICCGSIRRLSKFQPGCLVNHINDLLPVICELSAHLRSTISRFILSPDSRTNFSPSKNVPPPVPPFSQRNAILCIGEFSMGGCRSDGSIDSKHLESHEVSRAWFEISFFPTLMSYDNVLSHAKENLLRPQIEFCHHSSCPNV